MRNIFGPRIPVESRLDVRDDASTTAQMLHDAVPTRFDVGRVRHCEHHSVRIIELFGGGQVDITSGKFVFSCTEAYRIQNGKVGAPVKGATLIGNGPDVLTKVAAVGNDLALDPGVGTCGKDGQGVPVGVGLPTTRIDGLTVGGTAT